MTEPAYPRGSRAGWEKRAGSWVWLTVRAWGGPGDLGASGFFTAVGPLGSVREGQRWLGGRSLWGQRPLCCPSVWASAGASEAGTGELSSHAPFTWFP